MRREGGSGDGFDLSRAEAGGDGTFVERRANFHGERFTVDGMPVRRLDRYMVETDRFVVTYPEDNPFAAAPGSTFAGAVGTTLIFKHLEPGAHTIVNSLLENSDPSSVISLEARVVVAPR